MVFFCPRIRLIFYVVWSSSFKFFMLSRCSFRSTIQYTIVLGSSSLWVRWVLRFALIIVTVCEFGSRLMVFVALFGQVSQALILYIIFGFVLLNSCLFSSFDLLSDTINCDTISYSVLLVSSGWWISSFNICSFWGQCSRWSFGCWTKWCQAPSYSKLS